MNELKGVIDHIVEPITHICNKSFETCIFPEDMKIARVITVFKSGEKNNFNNYRSMSLLPHFLKC